MNRDTGTPEPLKILAISNGNASQIPFAVRMFESLRDTSSSPIRCAFISDDLDDGSVAILSDIGVNTHLLSGDFLRCLSRLLASDKHPLGKIAKPFFTAQYLWATPDIANIDVVCYVDPDIVFLRDIRRLISDSNLDKLHVSSQLYGMNETHWPKRQMGRALHRAELAEDDLHACDTEFNTGFFYSRPQTMRRILNAWTDFMSDTSFNFLRQSDANADNAFHDQDFFRVFCRCYGLNSIKPIPFESGVTLVARGDQTVTVAPGLSITLKRTGNSPYFVHFAGQSWKKFPDAVTYYDLSTRFPGVHVPVVA